MRTAPILTLFFLPGSDLVSWEQTLFIVLNTPDNSPPLSYLISSSTLCVAVILLLLFALFQPILLCFYSSSTCFGVWSSAYSTQNPLQSLH